MAPYSDFPLLAYQDSSFKLWGVLTVSVVYEVPFCTSQLNDFQFHIYSTKQMLFFVFVWILFQVIWIFSTKMPLRKEGTCTRKIWFIKNNEYPKHHHNAVYNKLYPPPNKGGNNYRILFVFYPYTNVCSELYTQ